MTIASGTSGTCTWSISDAGALTVKPTSGSSGYTLPKTAFPSLTDSWPWLKYQDQITSAAFSGTIKSYAMRILESPAESGNFAGILQGCPNLKSVTGLGSLSGAKNISSMLAYCSSLVSLDLSSLNTSLVSHALHVFYKCDLLTTVKLGAFYIPEGEETSFVIANTSSTNQTNGITVTSDKAFRSLTAAERQGVWTRGVSATYKVTAERSTGGTADEDGEDVTFTVTWATDATTTARTLTVYKKLASASSYPSTASLTQTLSGNSGVTTASISDIGDAAYDFKVEFYDGTSTFIAFPSVQSNIRLIEIDPSGDITLHGSIYYEGSKSTSRMIRFLDNDVDTYGNGVAIGGGGLTIVGAGESMDSAYAEVTGKWGSNPGTEELVLASDQNIHFLTNRNDTSKTTRYRIVVTNAEPPNLRVDKSTDSGATWTTETYFQKESRTQPVANGGTGITNFLAVQNTSGSNVSVANEKWAQLATISLAAGKWLVFVGGYAVTNATGRRAWTLTTNTAADASNSRLYNVNIPAASGGPVYVSYVCFIDNSATATWRVHGFQGSGSALNMSAYIRAVRIG